MTYTADQQTLSDDELLGLIGPERLAALDECDDGSIPTVVVEPSGGNVFLHFRDRASIEHLIEQLADVLSENNPAEMTVRVSGSVKAFRETWEE